MTQIRLREEPGEPKLGWNMHILNNGHQRLNFVMGAYKKGKILDVGCGEGGFSIWMARRGNYVTAIDVLDSSVAVSDPNIKFIKMDAMKMMWLNKYDTILLMEILEHVVKPDTLIFLCLKALAPKGKLLITTPWIGDWDAEPDHVWRFDKDSMLEMLKKQRLARKIEVTTDETFVYAVVTK